MSDSESEDHSRPPETGRSFQQEGLNTTQASSISSPSCLSTQSDGTEARTTTADVVTSSESTSRRIEQDIDPDGDTEIDETTSNQGTSSSAAERGIPHSERRGHEIMQLEKTDESNKRNLRAKEVIGVKSNGSQTSKEQELQLKINELEQTVSRLKEESKEKTVEVEKSFESMETYYKQQLLYLRKNNEDLNDKARALERKLQNKEEEINVTLADFGRALVERDTLVKEMKARGTAHSSPVPSLPEAPIRIRGAEAVTERDEQLTANSEATEENSESNGAAVAVQESQAEANRRDTISLANIPTTIVERGLYSNYKLLLLRITQRLLSGDVIKFKEWATSILAVDVTASVYDVFLELDRRGVISAINLEKLREFFEKIVRFDLVYMIDCFIVGDYSCLRNTREGTPRRNNRGITTIAQARYSIQETRQNSEDQSELEEPVNNSQDLKQ